MAHSRVKEKFHVSAILAVIAALTFLLSWAGLFSQNWVETRYARRVFPTISHIVGRVADAVPFSWLDLAIVCAVGILIYSVRWRRGWSAVGIASAAYLWFFWSWGVSYHRQSLDHKLGLEKASVAPEQMEAFIQIAASELNRLWPIVSGIQPDRDRIAQTAAHRVRLVSARLDGVDWVAATRIKHSILAESWFRITGVDGVFNPFGHEPNVASTLLPFELPFVFSHELAHVRGVPDEGDANLTAVLATLASGNPEFEYSGWFHLWLYLGSPERDKFLQSGPRRDLQLFYERIRSQQWRWASSLQSAVLDWHLKANHVEEGVESYARFVRLAAASRDRWQDFR